MQHKSFDIFDVYPIQNGRVDVEVVIDNNSSIYDSDDIFNTGNIPLHQRNSRNVQCYISTIKRVNALVPSFNKEHKDQNPQYQFEYN